MSGTIALAKLERLAQPQRLTAAIRELNGGAATGYDPRSCFMNNLAVIYTVTNQRYADAANLKAKRPQTMSLGIPHGQFGEHTKAVMQLLDTPVIIAFSLKFKGGGGGDHYFSAFPLDHDTIIVSMGWQGMYDFSDWFTQNNAGRFKRATFAELMRKAEDGDLDGIEGLCGFLGTTREGRSIPLALHNEIAGSKPTFHSTSYLDLPRS